MLPTASTWHAFFLLALLPGCFDMHGRPGPATDAGPIALDAGPASIDAGPAPVDATLLPPDAGGLCERAIALLRAGTPPSEIGCDGRTFPRECVARIGECCQLFLECAIAPTDGGEIVASLACTDLCDQSCAAQPLEDCALFPYCERFEPLACGPAPEGEIEGPACIWRRSGPCATDAECPAGEHCRGYWVNPCLDSPCDACGGTERHCSL